MALGAKRGVSPVVATLIMVAATIAVGSFAYWYVTNFAASASQQASLGVVATVINSSGSSVLQLSLKNLGSTSISVEKLVAWCDSGPLSITVNRILAAGATFSIAVDSRSDPRLKFTPGRSYSIIVMTNVGNFTSVATCIGG